MNQLAPSGHPRLLRRSRWRVAVLGALVVAGVLALLSACAYVVVRSATYAHLSERLEHAAVRATEVPGASGYLVIDERGRPLLETPELVDADESRDGLRIITDPRLGSLAVLRVPSAGGTLVIATPAQVESQALAEVLRVLAALTLVGGLVALPAGYALAGVALRPLDEAVRERNEFVALASHQLRTPLAVIKTAAELGRSGRGLSPREALDTILQQAGRIEGLAARLTALARAERDTASGSASANLVEIARDVVAGLSEAARQRGASIHAEGESVWVAVDPGEAADMLTAITENAIQFSPPGGTVSVRVEARGGRAIAEIRDQGPGIPPAELPLVTDPFYQGGRARGGYGLGLAIARAIAERHDGQLTIDSVEGQGTTVRIALPQHAAPVA
ncbi:MAG TPA: HAMP domain-containing sensor histidine kinase [bacterium]|nr:HAMP domain-containing sensor histidine kinase [bacterium]